MFLIKNKFFVSILLFITIEKLGVSFCKINPKVINFLNEIEKNQTEKFLIEQKINNLRSKIFSKFVYSDEEIKSTSKFKIDKKNFCFKDHGFGIDLIVMVVSSPFNFKSRNAIRQTWGGFSVERGSKLLFVIGQSSVPEINEKIMKEDEKYEDILQGQYQDVHSNLTLKSLSIINWINDNCEKAKYVLKVDDNMFVNMQKLVDFAETREFKNSIIGRINNNWCSKKKSYLSYFKCSKKFNQKFVTGSAYLIHRDAIPKLLKVINSNLTQVIKIDDVFLTGFAADKAGVKRLNYSLFKNKKINITKCNFKNLITSYQHSPKDILRLWENVYSDQKVFCFKDKSILRFKSNLH